MNAKQGNCVDFPLAALSHKTMTVYQTASILMPFIL